MASRRALYAALAATGAICWLVAVAVAGGPDAWGPFNVALWVTGLTAVAVAIAARLPAAQSAASSFGPPMLLALWTAPRGDDDGLWLLIFPFIVFDAVLAALAITAGRGILRLRHKRR